jgi:hypothetical protein
MGEECLKGERTNSAIFGQDRMRNFFDHSCKTRKKMTRKGSRSPTLPEYAYFLCPDMSEEACINMVVIVGEGLYTGLVIRVTF